MKRKLAPVEFAGGWICGNVWIKIGLSASQARELKQLSRRLFRGKDRTSAQAALWIIRQGLDNLGLLELATGQLKVRRLLAHADDEVGLDRRAWARLKHLN